MLESASIVLRESVTLLPLIETMRTKVNSLVADVNRKTQLAVKSLEAMISPLG